MKTRYPLSFALLLLSGFARAADISKPQSGYDIATEKNDLAEVTEDLISGKAIGKRIRFRLTAEWTEQFCSADNVSNSGKPMLYCHPTQSGATIHVYSKSKDVRIELQRHRAPSEKLLVSGVIIENYVNELLVEVEDLRK